MRIEQDEWKEWDLVDRATLKPLLVHRKALRSESIGVGCRTDFMDCPLCGKCVVSDSAEGVLHDFGSFRIVSYMLQNPKLPPHNEYLIWQLNKHLKEAHGTTPEFASTLQERLDISESCLVVTRKQRDAEVDFRFTLRQAALDGTLPTDQLHSWVDALEALGGKTLSFPTPEGLVNIYWNSPEGQAPAYDQGANLAAVKFAVGKWAEHIRHADPRDAGLL